jgi:hypothetical protein
VLGCAEAGSLVCVMSWQLLRLTTAPAWSPLSRRSLLERVPASLSVTPASPSVTDFAAWSGVHARARSVSGWAAERLVRQAGEQGLSLTGPEGLPKQLTRVILVAAGPEALATLLEGPLAEWRSLDERGVIARAGIGAMFRRVRDTLRPWKPKSGMSRLAMSCSSPTHQPLPSATPVTTRGSR